MATTVFNFPSTLDRIEKKLNDLLTLSNIIQSNQQTIIQQGINAMQGTSDLVAAVNELKTQVADSAALMDMNFQKLMDALNNAQIPPAEQAIIDQAAADIRAQIQSMKDTATKDTPSP